MDLKHCAVLYISKHDTRGSGDAQSHTRSSLVYNCVPELLMNRMHHGRWATERRGSEPIHFLNENTRMQSRFGARTRMIDLHRLRPWFWSVKRAGEKK